MNFYHIVFDGPLRGTVLHTLNHLKEHHPDLYERCVKKYKTREYTCERYIPLLDCKWGDVVFLSPFHPQTIYQALATQVGRTVPSKLFYEIPSHLLAAQSLAIWLFKNTEYIPTEVVPYSEHLVRTFQEIPDSTLEYFRGFRNQDDPDARPLLFMRVPHVLYKGSIDVSDLQGQYTRVCNP